MQPTAASRRVTRSKIIVAAMAALSLGAAVSAVTRDAEDDPVEVATSKRGDIPAVPEDPATAVTTEPAPTTTSTEAPTTTTSRKAPGPGSSSTPTSATVTTTTAPAASWPGPMTPRPPPGYLWQGTTTTGQYWQVQTYDPSPGAAAKFGLYVVAADGTNLRQLRDVTVGAPVWSPDGRWIAHNDVSLQVTSPQTGQTITVVKDNPMMFRGTPAWSADSTRLAIVMDPNFQVEGDADVSIVPIDASVPPAPISIPGDQYDEAWLPDGRLLILDGGGLWVVQPDGTGLRRIFTGSLARGRLIPSPDGRTAAVVQWSFPDDSVFLIGIDGGGASPRPVCGDGVLPRSREPRWSPGSDRLACPVTIDGRSATIVAPADGGPATVLDDSFTDPHWSPDGALIVGTGNPSGPYRDLVVIAPDATGRRTVLTASDRSIHSPRWSPDGREIAFTLGD